ncbi:hypothetical protein Clopa_0824 [Clostridium pasteurianum BC1]|uniref:Uncharacterized protein n=2 Tax=Clostridium pasteurianum TaxID=1501 RepID=R4K5N2_CLOPA|nr:hypothetical protein Clopa_0824 [Clostridium pasteurianum BC1]
MRTIKFIFSFFLSFILMFVLLIFQFSLFTHYKLYNANFYMDKFQKLGLYSYLQSSTNSSLDTIARVSNLPKAVFNNVVSQTWLKSQVENSTTGTIDYMTYKTNNLPAIDTNSLLKTFDENLDKFIKSSNITVDKSVQDQLNSIRSQSGGSIKDEINLFSFDTVSKSSSFQKIRKYLNLLYSYENIIILIIIIIAILLFIIEHNNIAIFISWIGYSLIAGGLLSLVPSLVGIFSRFTDNIAIGIPTIKIIVGSIISDYLKFFTYSSIIFIVLGIILVVISAYLERNSRGFISR